MKTGKAPCSLVEHGCTNEVLGPPKSDTAPTNKSVCTNLLIYFPQEQFFTKN
jgi:hypothetical protein